MEENRRPLKTRTMAWAKNLTALIAKTKISPNQISIIGIFFGLFAGLILALVELNPLSAFLAILFIQLRLLCNMLDGMLAVEYGKKSKTGELYNELPDRISDIFIIVGLGYACSDYLYGVELGYLATILALLLPYIRSLGVNLGAPNYFAGPMAKQHRMALISAVLLLEIVFGLLEIDFSLRYFSLYLLILGMLVTAVRRLKYIVINL